MGAHVSMTFVGQTTTEPITPPSPHTHTHTNTFSFEQSTSIAILSRGRVEIS
jgi:hypothetical protein